MKESHSYLYVLSVAVFVGRPPVVVVVESGLLWQPVFIVEARRGRDLVVGDLSRLHTERLTAVESCQRTEGERREGTI